MFEGMENNLKVVAVKPLKDTYVAIVTHINPSPPPHPSSPPQKKRKEKRSDTLRISTKGDIQENKYWETKLMVHVDELGWVGVNYGHWINDPNLGTFLWLPTISLRIVTSHQ